MYDCVCVCGGVYVCEVRVGMWVCTGLHVWIAFVVWCVGESVGVGVGVGEGEGLRVSV